MPAKEKETPVVPQGLRGRQWGPLLAATVPIACVPALVTRWVLVPLLQQRRARFDVCCRVRPINNREIDRGSNPCVSAGGPDSQTSNSTPGEPASVRARVYGELRSPASVTIHTDEPRTFDFDSVVTGTDQALPFAVVRPYVERFVDRAEPGAVVAYGQTAAGKTHTILGDPFDASDLDGMVTRGVRLILERLEASNNKTGSSTGKGMPGKASKTRGIEGAKTVAGAKRVLLVNMYELYMERLRELTPTAADIGGTRHAPHGFGPDVDSTSGVDSFRAKQQWAPPCHRDLAAADDATPVDHSGFQLKKLRECRCRETYVQASTPLLIDSAETFAAALAFAWQRRMVALTSMGESSSRSHVVISLGIATVPSIKDRHLDSKSFAIGPRFDFVDCAGSERQNRTGAYGQQLREATAINKSLSSLGNVVRGITTPMSFVPYRDSLLTRVLQRSAFADTARTLFIVCASPTDCNAAETTATLRFADMARGPNRTLPPEDVFGSSF